MAYLTRTDIDMLGERIFADYKQLPCLKGQSLQRLEPEILAKNLCGLNVGYYHLSKSGSILGLTSAMPAEVLVMDDDGNRLVYPLDGRTILIESDLYKNEKQRGRYHFTMVHEVSHQILDRLYPECGRNVSARIHYSMAGSRPAYPVTDWAEWQANVLSSTLLMPVELVLSALNSFGLACGIRILNKVFSPDVYDRFCQAADSLEVSKQALALRLKRMGLLGADYLDDPYRLVNVEVD